MTAIKEEDMKRVTLFEFARDSIKLFREYRGIHGCSEIEAMEKASLDMSSPDAGVELIGSEELKKLKQQAASLPSSIQEALNSGDGVYRP